MFYVGDTIIAQTSIDEVVRSLLKNFIKLEPSKGRDRGQLWLKYILNSISTKAVLDPFPALVEIYLELNFSLQTLQTFWGKY